jgi:NAD-dependent SIR2 family protein deacetylase
MLKCEKCNWKGERDAVQWDTVETCMGADKIEVCPKCGSMEVYPMNDLDL